MTLAISGWLYDSWPTEGIRAPHAPRPDTTTVVVPVLRNQAGIARLLRSIDAMPLEQRPASVIVVDNGSHPEIVVEGARSSSVTLAWCPTKGAAAARNHGWRMARTEWVLFLDSDCVVEPGIFEGYAAAFDGSIAYAGDVRALDDGPLSAYYVAQATLVPPRASCGRPQYLVTANALVLRSALERVGGFDTAFPGAGGEDIDIAVRLRRLGGLQYAPEAAVRHDFGSSLSSFVSRFHRYGRGNRILAERYDLDATPVPFVPRRRTATDVVLSLVQVAAMWWGYRVAE